MTPRRIRALDPLVAERIAAGEVVERPASVVKELVENSLDAGATRIQITLEEGGKARIEIIDNGHGIHPEDLEVALTRHATSKITTFEDLEKLSSLGFRGEALPSVTAVANLEIISRTMGSDAYRLETRDGRTLGHAEAYTYGHFLNSRHGTRISVNGLFSQVPARLKFLKSKGAEASSVREWVEKLALTRPDVGFELIHDGRVLLSVKPQEGSDSPLASENRIRELLADGQDYPIVHHKQLAPLAIEAWWIQGLSLSQTRKLIQIVNGRLVRDRMIQSAVLSSFSQSMLPGQFPALVVKIDIDPSQIDVNVHPSKTELRFRDSNGVFREIRHLFDQMIQERGAPGWLARDARPDASRTNTPQTSAFSFAPSTLGVSTTPSLLTPDPVTMTPREPSHTTPPVGEMTMFPNASNYRGTFFRTYLAYDEGQTLVLIDQHAAHERIRYEALKRRFATADTALDQATTQLLLIPETTPLPEDVSREDVSLRLEQLKRAGFDAEHFSESTLIFRSVPAEWLTGTGMRESAEIKTRLANLVDRVFSDSPQGNRESLRFDDVMFERIASEACHSALRAGDSVSHSEADALLGQLAACKHPWNCPHGRPTVVRIPEARFEEWFQRRVPH